MVTFWFMTFDPRVGWALTGAFSDLLYKYEVSALLLLTRLSSAFR